MKQGGDDLDDDFVLDETVAFSGDEDLVSAPLDDEDVFVKDDELIESPKPASDTKKRKRREKEKERKKRKVAESIQLSDAIPTLREPQESSDYLNSFQVKAFPKFSTLELEDVRIPVSAIANTSPWTGARTLDQLVSFIIKILPTLHTRLSQRSKANGSPTLIYLAGAALRVADVTRILKDKRLRGEKGGDVAKLFARHFKVAEQATYLKRTKIGTAVGTPGRIGQLLNEPDTLNVSQLSHIILDTSYKDAKSRTVLDIPETRDEIFKNVLNNERIMRGIKDGKIQLVLF